MCALKILCRLHRVMAEEEEVKLLGLASSPFVVRVAIALQLKKVAYQFVMEELRGQKSEILLKSNPVIKKVPVLLHRANAICESPIIVEYIDAVWPGEPPILPADPFHRALARFWTAFIDDKFPPMIRNGLNGTTVQEESKAEWAEEAGRVFQLLEAAFAECSQGKEWFGGDTIGYLDLGLGGYLGWIRVLEDFAGIKLLDRERVPGLAGWADRLVQEEAVKAVMPQTEEFVERAIFNWPNLATTHSTS